MVDIGVYLGSDEDDVSNVNNVLDSWLRVLSKSNHEIDLVGGSNVPQLCLPVSHCKVSKTRSRTPFGKVKDSYTHVSQYISENNPDVVIQLWRYQTHAPGVVLAGERHSVPTIVRFTGDVFQEFRGYRFLKSAGVCVLANLIGRIPLRFADEVVTMGPMLRQSVASRGVADGDIHIIPPPRPDRERFMPVNNREATRAAINVDTERPMALFVGRLTDQKGMKFLKQVMESVLPETDFQFVLVGEGPYRTKFRKKFPSERVVLPGYVSHDDIAKYYQAATVYVHPSQFEGLPLVILEALQTGTPVIARDAGDVSFVLEDVVKTPQEMTRRLLERDWNTEWQNERYFSEEYQREAISRLIDEAIGT